MTFFFTGPSDLWNYSFYTPVYNFTRHGLRTTAIFRRLATVQYVCLFFSLKCQNFVSDVIQCYSAKCVRLSAYKNMFVYITYHSFNDQSFHHWRKLCKSKLKSEIGFHIKYACSSNWSCFTLNGRTIFIKSHSIDNNTIYVLSLSY